MSRIIVFQLSNVGSHSCIAPNKATDPHIYVYLKQHIIE